MKSTNLFWIVAVVGHALLSSMHLPAASFQNLDFEHPNLPLVSNDPQGNHRVPIIDAFPGWSGYLDALPLSLVLTNANFLSAAGISLFGPGDTFRSLIEGDRIEGNYTAFLQSGTGLSSQGQFSSSLAQVGLVPIGMQSLQLRINPFGPFTVSLDGQALSLFPLVVTPQYTLYGADVSGFAGQEMELRITADYSFNPNNGLHGYLWLDSINFSPVPVPEPSWIGLVALGILGFWEGRRSLRRR